MADQPLDPNASEMSQPPGPQHSETGSEPGANRPAPLEDEDAAAGDLTEEDMELLARAADQAAAGSTRFNPASPAGARETQSAHRQHAPRSVTSPAEPGLKGAAPPATDGDSEETMTEEEIAASLELPEFLTAPVAAVSSERISMLSDVNLNVKIELGRTRMLIEDVLKLDSGSVVELDKLAGDPVDVFANDRLIARGEVLVLNDSFCVRISEVIGGDPHRVV